LSQKNADPKVQGLSHQISLALIISKVVLPSLAAVYCSTVDIKLQPHLGQNAIQISYAWFKAIVGTEGANENILFWNVFVRKRSKNAQKVFRGRGEVLGPVSALKPS
jgi:hypothetical protein